ncbi:hypothetical protein LEMA_P119120.1 [Plenodomus lingam JN3]|uniref:Uncharacterized protein n=1 Tax=Leptosphaeria maculans (strain JN3 / isolate v23.1.3 / race Av1-4-5-6-7-8) TaxID=985895 RepID=E4ZT83_LEPMJ|nr:hypothetical protein LEMA_P119120.1 [Plenodomus lingam JN3]CBX90025.1 hypothetical protein LEMA_P119120.1 [Plenodomus lingam JN3]
MSFHHTYAIALLQEARVETSNMIGHVLEEANEAAALALNAMEFERKRAQELAASASEHYEKAQAEAVDALGRLASRNWLLRERLLHRLHCLGSKLHNFKHSIVELEQVFGPQTSNNDILEELIYFLDETIRSEILIISAYGESGSGGSTTLLRGIKLENGNADKGLMLQCLEHVLGAGTEASTVHATCVEVACDGVYDVAYWNRKAP